MGMRLRAGLTSVALLASLLTVTGFGAGGEDGPPAPSAGPPVPEMVVTNNPSGSAAQQNAIETHVRELIKGAPPGSTIRYVSYYTWAGALTADLIAAHRDRGVDVQVVLDELEANNPKSALPSLADALGTNTSAKSFVKVCPKGKACIGPKGGITHSKFWLFSQTGGSHNVIVSASANISPGSRQNLWNSSVTLVGRDKVYEGFRAFFTDMARTGTQPNYYRTAAQGPAEAFFFPRAGAGDATDTIVGALQKVSCTKQSTGSPTTLRVNMFSLERPGVARQLWELGRKGCKVDIVYSFLSDGAHKELLKKSGNYHGPSLWPSQNTYVRGCVTFDTFTHEKYLLIEGGYAGKSNQKIVFSGSHNYTSRALRTNNEQLVKLASPALYDGYRQNFLAVRASLQPRLDPDENGLPDAPAPPRAVTMPRWLLEELDIPLEQNGPPLPTSPGCVCPAQGDFAKKWKELGAQGGKLKCPTSNSRKATGGVQQSFVGGTLYWSRATGAHVVWKNGAIGPRYTSLGADGGRLGLPVTDEWKLSSGKGWRQIFQHGRITWDKGTKKTVVTYS